jgi:hypothetical protein
MVVMETPIVEIISWRLTKNEYGVACECVAPASINKRLAEQNL